MDLSDKVVVITGGAGLTGSAFCKAVTEYKGLVVIADNNVNAAELLADKLNASAKREVSYACYVDINSKSSIETLLKFVDNKFGRVNALVNNAYPRNKNYGRGFFDVDYKDFCENINLNLGGYFLTSQLFSQYFIKQGYGNIINVASIYGVAAPKFEIYEGTNMTMPVEYSAIKSALIHLTKYMAKYLKGKNIRINAISPGGIFDNQHDSFISKYREECLNKGMLDASDITGTLIFLLSDQSQYMNGQNIIVDDGFTL